MSRIGPKSFTLLEEHFQALDHSVSHVYHATKSTHPPAEMQQILQVKSVCLQAS